MIYPCSISNVISVKRLTLDKGLGTGPESATATVFAAECSPDFTRGALLTLWQLLTALGIFLGALTGLLAPEVRGAKLNPQCDKNITSINVNLLSWTCVSASIRHS